ncbi:O-antigen ligase family protein [Caulobacter sp. 17J65-9]|uniref:O-antigen ligase family protein n=1 Tax=Caulobacter sp. 17J65-9 TaxID=2709382 RepID=UPI0013C8290D|nr:O-antigen ligase family protein [Caulobacter sp. 17J65-9]NEX94076.1 O-antigen ligase family protein [Caulobacter sp. 17J65-9]
MTMDTQAAETQAVQPWRAPRVAPAAFASGRYWSPEWVLSFGSFTALLTVVATDGKSLYVMLGLLGLYLIAFWKEALTAMLPVAPLLALPALAMASTLWSEAPMESFRHGLQFGLTVFIALLIARRTPGPAIIGSAFAALLLAGVLSLQFGRWVSVGFQQGSAFAGIFGSKNEMAVIASLLALAAGAAVADPRQPMIMRVAGVGGLMLAALLLRTSQSAGAVVSTILAGGLFVILILITRMRFKWRALAAAAVLFATVPAAFMAEQQARTGEITILRKLGKDPTLTGRTYLWQRAEGYIARRPVLGHGYQAFWRRGSLEAEGLWRFANIRSRAGFNFHNQYIEVLVELGWVGLITLVCTLAVGLAAFAARLMFQPTPTVAFGAAGFLLLLSRTPLESITLVQFSVATFVLFLTAALALAPERRLQR